IELDVLQRQALRDALRELAAAGLTVVVAEDKQLAVDCDGRQLRLSIIANDRLGIGRDVAAALAQHHINLREMDTTITSAAMTAEPLFEALAEIEVPRTLDLAELNEQLAAIADALTVDIALEESLR